MSGSATPVPPMSRALSGVVNGLIGVIIFSGSLPATRVAVADFDPMFLTFARAAIAGCLAGVMLLSVKVLRPTLREFRALAVVALGVVVGFPLLTGFALRLVTATHAIVFIGLLPLSTAIFGVLLGGDRPKPLFWVFSVLGSSMVAVFAVSRGLADVSRGDVLMLGAIVLCGLGYAEGGRLSRRLGGWQVISWALVLSLPLMAPLALWTAPHQWSVIGWPALAALAYISLFSMLIGFVFWYKGLADGGTASVGQLQLLQPFFSLILSAALLGEVVSWQVVALTVGVVVCVFGARRHAR